MRQMNFAGATVDCVLLPTIRREWTDLLDWLFYLPAPCQSQKDRLVLVLALDDVWSEEDKRLIRSVAAHAPGPAAWSVIEFCDCRIPVEESVYWRFVPADWPEHALRYGLKSGPNQQFFRSMKWIAERGISRGAVLLLETDTVPLAPGWLDVIDHELVSAEDYLLAGSRYLGQSELLESFVEHINGNAVMNVAHPQWPRLMALWEEILLALVQELPEAAYDIALEWCLARVRHAEGEPWATWAKSLEELYLPRRVYLRSLINLGGRSRLAQIFTSSPPRCLNVGRRRR